MDWKDDNASLMRMTAREIENAAHDQLMGGYSAESDAITALRLIKALANRLQRLPTPGERAQ